MVSLSRPPQCGGLFGCLCTLLNPITIAILYLTYILYQKFLKISNFNIIIIIVPAGFEPDVSSLKGTCPYLLD